MQGILEYSCVNVNRMAGVCARMAALLASMGPSYGWTKEASIAVARDASMSRFSVARKVQFQRTHTADPMHALCSEKKGENAVPMLS